MEYKIDYKLPGKEDLKGYAKDTLTLIGQNKWLSLKLVVFAIVGSAVIGSIIKAPLIFGYEITISKYSPEFLFFVYQSVSEILGVLFNCVPFWLILFYTGFRLMENQNGVIIPSGFVIKKQIHLLKHFWSSGLILILSGFLLIFLGITTVFPESKIIKEVGDSGLSETILSLIFSLSSESMIFGNGFYWFSFIHIAIFSALLFGTEFTPNLAYTIQNLFTPKFSMSKRFLLLFIFAGLDIFIQLVSHILLLVFDGVHGFIIATLFRSMCYLFIAGILYCYCVDNIEGRKLKKKVKVEKFSGSVAPSLS